MSDPKPRGKEATINALLDAADELFAEKGPNSVTVREISSRANVNHGLLHRHFGSKEAMLDQVLDRHVRAFTQALATVNDPKDTIPVQYEVHRSRPSFLRLLAFLILERREAMTISRRSGGVAAFASALRPPEMSEEGARRTAAILSSFVFGWRLFGGFTTTAAGCEAEPEALDGDVERILTTILEEAIAAESAPAKPE